VQQFQFLSQRRERPPLNHREALIVINENPRPPRSHVE
jgi:hypothetical protein